MAEDTKSDNRTFVMWSDGNITSFGVLLSEENGTLKVKNPAYVIFDVRDEMRQRTDGTLEKKKMLSWHVQPYVFPAVIDGGEMVWDIHPRHIFNREATYNKTLVEIYDNVIALAARLDEGEIE